ncbi:MAG: glycoside hydrolase family 3 C-terminal domain-containing protein [Candidatus Omnitrophica bacterium]|nr:glycoside hydrolase family 3 C-terminal domain-containing protein [Candidatus Omnitrophota bacterium]MDD5546992.1 glycoside hydrolase family 3 C-terminal domain-containing protein [Candidatus Omnitrophota bacterium]
MNMFKYVFVTLLVTFTISCGGLQGFQSETQAVAATAIDKAENLAPVPAIETRINDLLKQMSLAEKLSLCHANSKFNTAGIERLGIPRVAMSDGPHGVRRETAANSWEPAGWEDDYVTYLPTGSALASTWNREMGRRFGETLGAEARHRNKDILLGPGINIVRTPVCGRNFEYYGEDPYQVGQMASEVVRGIQSNDVAACVKHYALNNQEWNRGWVNVVADERTLREIYLPAFEAAVRAGAWTVMTSYNKFRGQWCGENKYLMNDILKGAWGFDGVCISDWGGTHSTRDAAVNGLDIEMGTSDNYDTFFFANPLRQAVERGEIPESVVDDKVRRILRFMIRAGMIDPSTRKTGSRNTAANQQAVRDVAGEAMVLLKNDGVLPLDINKTLKLAVIGENAVIQHANQGGSSAIRALYEITPLEGLKRKGGGMVKITYVEGYRDTGDTTVFEAISDTYVQTTDPKSGIRSWKGEYFNDRNLNGQPVEIRYEKAMDFNWKDLGPAAGVPKDNFSARWTADILPTASGIYHLGLTSDDGSRLKINGKVVIDNWADHAEERKDAKIELTAGQTYHFEVEYYESSGDAMVKLGWVRPDSRVGPEVEFAEAIKAARAADAVLVFAGQNHQYDKEGEDRRDIRLHGRQNELIEAVAAANPRTAVFLVSGSAVEMPWIDKVPCVVQAWYAGMEVGNTVADIVFGDINPSGKLPITFPKRLEDCPAHAIGQYNDKDCEYKEGLLVGYRYYDTRNVEPLFPFGHGLSYTTFKYSNLNVDPKTLVARVDITNTGKRKGKEVVQLYVHDVESRLPRPVKELKGFEKVELAPGETKQVIFRLDERALAFYDAEAKGWVAEPGEFDILVGSSSRDIRLQARFAYAARQGDAAFNP